MQNTSARQQGAGRAVIIGAYSVIASAIARELALRGWHFLLAGRDPEKLQVLAEDLCARGAGDANFETLDVLKESSVDAFFDRLAERNVHCKLVIVAAGVTVSNKDCSRDVHRFRQMVETNFSGNAHCALRSADLLLKGNGGEIMVISSVSGDRGRPRNFFYGSTKAGLNAFLEGLRLSLAGTRVNVMNLKPGPVGARVRAGMSRDLFSTSPELVARIAVSALGKGRHRVYAPAWWRYAMGLVRLLPGSLLAKLGI
jgi:short-subunit dehydrogenase